MQRKRLDQKSELRSYGYMMAASFGRVPWLASGQFRPLSMFYFFYVFNALGYV